MKTYSVRCRHHACRVRRVVTTHPDDMQGEQCAACGNTKGWRFEDRAYNRRDLCTCDGVQASQELGKSFPHNTTHPLCDHHPRGPVNQALRRGLDPFDLPLELMGEPCTTDDAPF